MPESLVIEPSDSPLPMAKNPFFFPLFRFSCVTLGCVGALVVGTVRAEDASWLVVSSDADLGPAGAGVTLASDAGIRATAPFTSSNRELTLLSGLGYFDVGTGLVTWTGPVGGTGGLVKQGTGTLRLNSASSFTGGLVLQSGSIELGANQAAGAAIGGLTINGTLDLNGHWQTTTALSGNGTILLNYGKLTLDLATDSSLATRLSGYGELRKDGSGTLTLASANSSFGGYTTVTAGTLALRHSDALGYSSRITLAGGSLDVGGLTFDITRVSGSGIATGTGTFLAYRASDTYVIDTSLQGSAGLLKAGAGIVELSGTNTFSGYTTVNGGTLRTTGANTLSQNSALFLIANSVLDLAGFNQTVGDLDSYNFSWGLNEFGTVKLGGATLTNLNRVTNNWAGSITGTGNFVKKGAAVMNWYAANTFTGMLSVDAGTLRTHIASSLSANAAVSIASGAILDLNNHAQTVAALSGPGAVTLGTATLTVSGTQDSVFSGSISGGGSVVKSGSSRLELTAANTYSGGTKLEGGTLRAGRAGAFGSGAIEIEGGTLDLAGYAISNSIINRGGLVMGFSRYAGTQTVTGAASYSGAVAGTVQVSSGGAVDTTGAEFVGTMQVGNGGILTGSGTVASVTIANGGTVTPGNSSGILHSGDTLWEGGGIYIWEMSDGIGAAGTAYDLIDIEGSLTIAPTLENPFLIKIRSLNLEGNAGFAENIASDDFTYVWTIATASGGIVGFDPALFHLDTTDFQNQAEDGGYWSLQQDDLNLNLIYSAIPEPGTWVLLALGGVAAIARSGIRRSGGRA